MTSKASDDLEAVRTVVEALEGFTGEERERILRWSREKLGMPASASSSGVASTSPTSAEPRALQSEPQSVEPPRQTQDIRAFILEKKPASDLQFAAAIAYYYRFVAQGDARKEVITREDLTEACRQVGGRNQPLRPAQVLVDAHKKGLLDRAETGQYKINTVGENLVAMVLPEGSESTRPEFTRKRSSARRKSGRAKR